MSNTAKFWIGVVLALPVLVAVTAVVGLLLTVVSRAGGGRNAVGGVLVVATLLLVIGLWRATASDRVRYLALGVVAGIAVVLLVLAGTCVVLLSQLGAGTG